MNKKQLAVTLAMQAFCTIVLIALVAWLCNRRCEGAVRDCYAASCRVHAPGAMGSGVTIMSRPVVWVLSNAHVVGELDDGKPTMIECEFWWPTGREWIKSEPIEGTLIWRQMDKPKGVDAAVIQIPRSSFWGRVPPALPLAPPDYVYPKGMEAVRASCPGGQPLRVIPSRLERYHTGVPWMKLTPAAEGGESGCGVFDSRGNFLLGLVAWTDGTHALAQYCSLLHSRLHPPEHREFRPERVWETALEVDEASTGFCDRFRQGGGDQGQQPAPNPYPTLPGYGPEATVDQSARQEIAAMKKAVDELSDQVEDLQDELAQKETAIKEMFGEDLEELTELVDGAKAAAEGAGGKIVEARGELAKEVDDKIAEAVEKIPQVDVSSQVEDRVGVIRDGLTKLEDRVEQAKAEGAEGVREVAKKVVWGIVQAYGWPLGGALGLALFLLWRRIEAKREAGEPLLLERAAARLRERVGGLDEDSIVRRVADRMHQRIHPESTGE